MKKKTLNFQEKILMFIKKTKPSSARQALILTPIIIAVLAFAGWMERSQAIENPKLAQNNDDELTLTMVGDIMMGRHIKEITDRYGEDFVFRNVKGFFEKSDYVSGNYEHPVIMGQEESYEKLEKNIHLSSTEQDLQTVKDAGFDVLSLANNHTMDFGSKGIEDTMQAFKQNKVEYVGAGNNIDEAKEAISYKEVDGVRIATVGFNDTLVPGMKADENRPGVLSADPDLIFEVIQKAKENADLIVVNAHWGQEYDVEPSPRQEGLAKAMVDAGADVIVGHHPHVVQSFDVYNGAVIFYSLGNFVFDQGWSNTKNSAMVQYHLNKQGEATVDVIPMQIKEGSPQPTESKWKQNRIYRDLTKYSSNEARLEKEGDKFQLKLDHEHVIERAKERKQKEEQQKTNNDAKQGQSSTSEAPVNNTEEAYPENAQ
ncbi:CapA family protein [Metabacillus iocasae]|uniref:Poly-gamma-glutamate synthesis protein (Capsule biosynthesis protein) n=1 Tax=Priestia iocasae TaxID=2291674 RepID=A0ABS2QUE5_9BACI|nr:CapA family protein [Metabacillus iocasae]MBM7703091.1 poly-gamma-glutamate synthesis protein (capsule biosynthesis protein) [Metabacillus iocasae]